MGPWSPLGDKHHWMKPTKMKKIPKDLMMKNSGTARHGLSSQNERQIDKLDVKSVLKC